LAGDQIDGTAPRRWLLISREVPLASDEGGAWRWSIDHVFLDQDAVPTLVEVKRSTDTRIRREVVGQMLDYAANAVVYWPVEAMQAQFDRRCQEEEADPLQVFADAFDVSDDIAARWEQFWQQAKTNLQAGKIRMVFVADKIPAELQRIVEFLNGQMDPAQVLALEVKQYVGHGQRAMVPRVIGQIAEPKQPTTSVRSPGRQWDEQSFFAALATDNPAEVVSVVREIMEWVQRNGWQPRYGQGSTRASSNPAFECNGRLYNPLYLSASSGRLQVNFGWLKSRPPFDRQELRRGLLARLNQIDDIDLPPDSIESWPAFELALLIPESSLRQFLDVLAWVADEVRSHQPG
jgi:hypothetical protein